MKISPMTPRYLQEAFLNICIIIGTIVGVTGLIFWIISGFSNWDALLVTALGAMIFFGFRYVKQLQSEYSMASDHKDSEE